MKHRLPIEITQEHGEALKWFEKIPDVKKGSPGYSEVWLRPILISGYETKHFSLPVNPIEIIKSAVTIFATRLPILSKNTTMKAPSATCSIISNHCC
jgi:hypothetical protein